MSLFSERNGIVKAPDIIIKNDVPEAVANAICSALDGVGDILNQISDYDPYRGLESEQLEILIWTHFLNNRRSQFITGNVEEYIVALSTPWYKKLDLIEFVLKYLKAQCPAAHKFFADDLNGQFERLKFGYTIVADQIIERISDTEIDSVETAISKSNSAVSEHFKRALELYSQRPEGDYPNSIKESISAVECACRERTGAKNLGEALNAFEKKRVQIHPRLKAAFEQMYAYTNQPNTGIRHAMMDTTGSYSPGSEEALYFLVTCSAFVNYLHTKTSIKENNG